MVSIHPIDEGICQHIHIAPVRKAKTKLLRMVSIWRMRVLPTWCRHIHVAPVRKAETKLLRMVSIWRIQSQLTRALPTWLMSAYPHRASEKSQNEAIEDGEHSSRNWWMRVLPTWCRHIHVVLVRKGSLMKLFLEGIPLNWRGALPAWRQHIHVVPAHLMSAYLRRASERNGAAVGDG